MIRLTDPWYAFLLFFILNIFFLYNIALIGAEGVGNALLGVFIVGFLAFFIFGFYRYFNVVVSNSFLSILAFFCYLLLRFITDGVDFKFVFSHSFGTTGGVILFYFIGLSVSVLHRVFDLVLRERKLILNYGILNLILSVGMVSFWSFLWVYFYRLLRSDIYLIDGSAAESYQRPGDFIVIVFIIQVVLYSYYQSVCLLSSTGRFKLIRCFTLLFLILSGLFAISIAQFIGSNKAFIIVLSIVAGIICVEVLLRVPGFLWFIQRRRLSFISLLIGSASKYTFVAVVFGSLLVLLLTLAIVWFSNIEFYKLRAFGFGSGEVTSITSRLELLGGFWMQFAYSSGIGDLLVDCKTSGCGTYAHSIIASLLTHLGVGGLIIVLVYIGAALFESGKDWKHSGDLFGSNVRTLYSYSVLAIVFFVSIVGVHFTWSVFWFACGLYLPSIFLKRKLSLNG